MGGEWGVGTVRSVRTDRVDAPVFRARSYRLRLGLRLGLRNYHADVAHVTHVRI